MKTNCLTLGWSYPEDDDIKTRVERKISCFCFFKLFTFYYYLLLIFFPTLNIKYNLATKCTYNKYAEDVSTITLSNLK